MPFDFEMDSDFLATLILPVAVGLSILMALLAAWFGYLERQPIRKRLQDLMGRRELLKAGRTAMTSKKKTSPHSSVIHLMGQLLGRFDLMRSKMGSELSTKLTAAGFRSKDALIVLLFMKVSLPVALGLVGLVVVPRLDLSDWPATVPLLMMLTPPVIGMMIPDKVVSWFATRRKKKLKKALPDALDLLVICAEAGLSLDAAVGRVAKEMKRSAELMSRELETTRLELGFLPVRRQALINLAERTDLPEIRSVVNTLVQTERYGTPLAQSLRVLSASFRLERLTAAEGKAARLPAQLSVPLVGFILPPLFIIIMGPAIISALNLMNS